MKQLQYILMACYYYYQSNMVTFSGGIFWLLKLISDCWLWRKKGAINTAHITAVLQLIDTLIRENESARPIVQIQVQIFSKRSNRLLHQRGHIKTGLHVMVFLGLHQLCCSLPYSIINLYMWFIIIVYGEATMINMYVPHTKTCVRKTTSMPECCPEHNFQHCWHTVHFYHPWRVQLSVVRLYL